MHQLMNYILQQILFYQNMIEEQVFLIYYKKVEELIENIQINIMQDLWIEKKLKEKEN